MHAWDQRIDSFWGKDAKENTEISSHSQTISSDFAAAVTKLVEALDQTSALAALGGLGQLMKHKELRWSAKKKQAVAAEDVEKLRLAAEALLPTLNQKPRDRDLLLRLLVFCDDPRSLPAVKAAAEQVKSTFIIFEIAKYRARHGDVSVAPILRKALELPTWNHKIKTAKALAKIGDPAGRTLLSTAMHSARLNDIMDGAEGLADLGDPEVFEKAIFDESRRWRSDKILSKIIESAGKFKGPLGNATLLHLANTASPKSGARARELLENASAKSAWPMRKRPMALFLACVNRYATANGPMH